MTAYLDVAGFKALSLIADERVDELVARYPDFMPAKLEEGTAWIDGRLRKRYAAPFAQPYPVVVKSWLAKLVQLEAQIKLGVDPNDEQFVKMSEFYDNAQKEITEAAEAEKGLFDLPLRADTTSSGISRGGTRAYSEQSPYVAFDQQRSVGRNEDGNGRGSDV
jgi:hypothetical protein